MTRHNHWHVMSFNFISVMHIHSLVRAQFLNRVYGVIYLKYGMEH